MSKTNILIASIAILVAAMGAYIYTMQSSTPMIDTGMQERDSINEGVSEPTFSIQANSSPKCNCDDPTKAKTPNNGEFTCGISVTACVHDFCNGGSGTCKVGSKSIKVAGEVDAELDAMQVDSTTTKTLMR